MTTLRVTGLCLALSLAIGAGACGGEEKPAAPSAKRSAKPMASAELRWSTPDGFKEDTTPKPMRLATFTFPRVEGDGEDAELTVTRVGGDKDSNIRRWKGQIPGAEPVVTEETVGELKLTFVTLEGTFIGMPQPGAIQKPKEGFTMVVAMVEWPGHGDAHFFKLTGPSATVEKARPAFEAMVRGLKHD